MCYECNGHGHLKKECPNYLRGKGKVFTTTLVILTAQTQTLKENVIVKGIIKAFMAIASVESKDDLSNLVDELHNISEDEEIEESKDEDVCQM